MSSKTFSCKNKDKIALGLNEASEHVISEGELLIKKLVEKQTNPNILLKEQLANVKQFEKPTELIPLENFTWGKTSLEDFRQCAVEVEEVEKLKYLGLSASQIELYRNSQKGDAVLAAKHKNISKNVLTQQLNEIDEIINKRCTPDNDSEKSNVSRHLKEVALCVKPNSIETKLLKFALSSDKTRNDNKPSGHPINNLKELEKDLFGHLEKNPIPTLSKRRRKFKDFDQNNYTDHCKPTTSKMSKWDVKCLPEVDNETSSNSRTNFNEIVDESSRVGNAKVYTCKPERLYTVQDGRIVKLENSVSQNGQTELKLKEYQKMSEEELRKLPRFQNYEPGNPSKVLYVKNIANSAKEEFTDLFKFDGQKDVNCKLLTGKMKGQAFLTFQSIHLATEALIKYNGYVLNGKPIVIQYGKSQC